MAIQIEKILTDLKIVRKSIEEFLQAQGIAIDRNINTLIDDWIYDILVRQFQAKLSFNLPSSYNIKEPIIIKQPESLSTSATREEIANGIKDDYGAVYSKDGYRLLKGPNVKTYKIRQGTKVICRHAFVDQFHLQSIEIPDSITKIGLGVFGLCRNLRSIEIPHSVIEIEANPFLGSGVRSIVNHSPYFYTDNDALYTHNKDTLIAYYGKTSDFIIPDTVKSIGFGAFAYSTSLQSIGLSSSITSIGDFAFERCLNPLLIVIPETVTHIGINPFLGSRIFIINKSSHFYSDVDVLYTQNKDVLISYLGNSSNFVIPDTVKSIGTNAFYGCRSLQSIEIPNSVKIIGDRAFAWCKNLQSIEIPNSVKMIGDSAFAECHSLQSIEILNSIRSIGDRTFMGCENLKAIIIPNGTMQYYNDLFSDYCDNLIEIKDWELSLSTEVTKEEIYDGIQDKYGALYSSNMRRLYRGPNIPFCQIKPKTRVICDGAFEDCSELTCVMIPNSVAAIGKGAFSGTQIEMILILGNREKFEKLLGPELSNRIIEIDKI